MDSTSTTPPDSIADDPTVLLATAALLKRSVSVPHITPSQTTPQSASPSFTQQPPTTTIHNNSSAVHNNTTSPPASSDADFQRHHTDDNAMPSSSSSALSRSAEVTKAAVIALAIAAEPLMQTAPRTPTPMAATTTINHQHPTTTGSPCSSSSGSSCSGQFNPNTFRTQKSSSSLPSAAASISFGHQLSAGGSAIRSSGDSPNASPCSSPHNIFGAHRTRRYSTGFSPLAAGGANGNCSSSSSAAASGSAAGVPMLRLTPRVSQLRQEECADISNSREVSHERDVHSALQITQSWEDLSLDASDSNQSDRRSGGGHSGSEQNSGGDLSNPLHVSTLGLLGLPNCSSPSPTSNRAAVRLPPYGLSPSPTRRTFATRRSMSPIAMRPSSLGPVKRKFEMDEQPSQQHPYHSYASSPPPFKKMFCERGQSPIIGQSSHHHQQQLPYGASIYTHGQSQFTCPSPDSTECGSGGRSTPKLFMSKLCTNSSSSFSSSSSPSTTSAPSPSMEVQIDLPVLLHEPMQTNAEEPQQQQTQHQSEAQSRIEAGDDADTNSTLTEALPGCSTVESSSVTAAATTTTTTPQPAHHGAVTTTAMEITPSSASDAAAAMSGVVKLSVSTTTETPSGNGANNATAHNVI